MLTNTGSGAVSSAEVMVMLFGAGHTLLGYGRGYTRALLDAIPYFDPQRRPREGALTAVAE